MSKEHSLETELPSTQCCGSSVSNDTQGQPSQTREALSRKLLLQLSGLIALWFALYSANQKVWDWIFYDALSMDSAEKLTETLHFFFYDSIKIVLLLSGIIFVVTVLRSFMSVEKTRAILGGKREGVGNAMAATLGIVTPFCSCSAVPAFIGFVAAGVPLGVTFSFLIASPLINEIAIGMLWTLFGWKIALIYVASGLAIAITAGVIIGRLKTEKWVESFVFETRINGQLIDSTTGLSFSDRIQMGREEVINILIKSWKYILVGIGLGAIIHGWIPEEFFTTYAGENNPFGVLIAVLVGIPLYSSTAAIMPMVEALFAKGLPMGTLLAFMMATVALSLPEIILLRRVLMPQLLAVFAGVVGISIVAIGYLFNAIL